jgi:uncharacterized protein
MKKLFLSLVILISVLVHSHAQSSSTLLYEISGNGLNKPSYLYGTIHLLCESDYIMPDKLSEKLNGIEQIVLELDMDDPSMMGKMQQNMSMKDGRLLKDLVTPEEYESLKTYFQSNLGMPLEAMGMIKPMILSSFLYTSILGCPLKSYEMEMVNIAKTESIEVLGLETVEFQMGMFDEIPYQDQANMLVEMIQDVGLAKEEFEKLVIAYKKGNPDELLEIMNQSAFELGEDAMTKMIDDRNADWIQKIGEMAKDKSSVFAVGAGHLGGNNGVINLLKSAGYTVSPIL